MVTGVKWIAQLDNDMKDSLSYQVVMAARRAITWLQARPEVDGARIGVTGASYGGVFSSMIAGIDPRIAAALAHSSARSLADQPPGGLASCASGARGGGHRAGKRRRRRG